MTTRSWRWIGARAALVATWLLVVVGDANAWDAATTHAGLTEAAALRSQLARRFPAWFGAQDGLFSTLRLDAHDARTTRLSHHLSRLDASVGVLPQAGRLSALQWIVAGAVLEEVPPERRRNHFFDPTTGRGLLAGGPLAGAGFAVAEVAAGTSSLSALVAGEAFDGTGRPSVTWLASATNELGVTAYLDARARAVSAATPAERESALAEALLAAGAISHVVEDAAVPAYVHNDLADLGTEGSLIAFAAARYGRFALPPLAGAPTGDHPVAHLADLVHAADGSGLADRTARRFYSRGQLASDARTTAPPELPRLVAGEGREGYVYDAERRHVARWVRGDGERVRFELDARCDDDALRTLLPEAGRAAQAALDHLFRDPLVVDGREVKNGALALGRGTLVILVEDEGGRRREIAERQLTRTDAGAALAEIPEGATGRLVVAVFRGVDDAGEPIVTHVEASP